MDLPIPDVLTELERRIRDNTISNDEALQILNAVYARKDEIKQLSDKDMIYCCILSSLIRAIANPTEYVEN